MKSEKHRAINEQNQHGNNFQRRECLISFLILASMYELADELFAGEIEALATHISYQSHSHQNLLRRLLIDCQEASLKEH